MTSVMTFQT